MSDALDSLSDVTGVDGFSYRGSFFKYWEQFPPVSTNGTVLRAATQTTASADASADAQGGSQGSTATTDAGQGSDTQSYAPALAGNLAFRAALGILALIALVF